MTGQKLRVYNKVKQETMIQNILETTKSTRKLIKTGPSAIWGLHIKRNPKEIKFKNRRK